MYHCIQELFIFVCNYTYVLYLYVWTWIHMSLWLMCLRASACVYTRIFYLGIANHQITGRFHRLLPSKVSENSVYITSGGRTASRQHTYLQLLPLQYAYRPHFHSVFCFSLYFCSPNEIQSLTSHDKQLFIWARISKFKQLTFNTSFQSKFILSTLVDNRFHTNLLYTTSESTEINLLHSPLRYRISWINLQ